jgi:hypothetical protein
MDLSVEKRRRLQELIDEAKEIVGGCVHADGRPKTFAELEDECIEVGDLFTAELLLGRVIQRDPAASSACCPDCDRTGERVPDEPRLLQTDRSEVGWTEVAYYCGNCRRSFFPSLG